MNITKFTKVQDLNKFKGRGRIQQKISSIPNGDFSGSIIYGEAEFIQGGVGTSNTVGCDSMHHGFSYYSQV